MALVRNNNSEIVYQRSMTMRWATGVGALIFLVLTGSFVSYMLPTAAYLHHRAPWEIASRAALLPISLAMLFIISLFGYMAGPDDLRLDLKTGQYRWRRGFPGLARWQAGSFLDIECLYTKKQNAKKAVCQMLLGWKGTGDTWFVLGDGALPRRKDALLGSAKSMEAAFAQIQPIAARLGVPAEDGSLPPRSARNQRQIRKMRVRVLPLICGGMALFYLLVGVPSLLTSHLLDTEGRTVVGMALGRRAGQRATRVDFRYTVSGETYTVSASVRDMEAAQIHRGDPVVVTYLPDYPHTARIRQSLGAGQSVLFIFLALVSIACLLYSLARDTRIKSA